MSFYVSASYVYPVSSPPLQNGVLSLSEEGTVLAVFSKEDALKLQIKDIKHYDGLLVPGFVNTHCHLELSHLAGRIPTGTGLNGFVKDVMQHRFSEAEVLESAMLSADQEMFDNGIVAVGDISNQLISREVKLKSKMYYHTFVEAMGFNPVMADQIITNAIGLKDSFDPLKATIVPHAPYSVSTLLMQKIKVLSGNKNESVTIHNQESEEENIFFQTKQGQFLALYDFLKVDLSFFEATGKSSLQNYLPHLSELPRTLLVHNTYTRKEDVKFAMAQGHRLFWGLCPNANLYIESVLPDIDLLRKAGCTITLGTDSLASNHQLSILAEMLTLQTQKAIPFDELLLWATLNGAVYLGIDNRYGSFEKGKTPGINLINSKDPGKLQSNTTVTRLY